MDNSSHVPNKGWPFGKHPNPLGFGGIGWMFADTGMTSPTLFGALDNKKHLGFSRSTRSQNGEPMKAEISSRDNDPGMVRLHRKERSDA